MACIKPGSKLDQNRRKWEAHLVAQGIPAAQAAQQAEQMATNAALAAIKKTRQQVWLQAKTAVDIADAMTAAGGHGAKGIADIIERSTLRPGDTTVTMQSAQRGFRAVGDSLLSPAHEVFLRAERLSDADRYALNEAVRSELLGKATGNSEAKKAADAIRKAADWRKATANDAGMDIKTLGEWGYTQRWDAEKVAPGGDTTEWVDAMVRLYETPGEMAPLLDASGAPLVGPELRDVVQGMADNIRADNVHGEIGMLPGAMKSRHKQPRVIHFLNPDTRLAIENRFADVDVLKAADQANATFAREVGAMKVFGPNPDRNFAVARERAARAGASDTELARLDSLYLQATGALDRAASPTIAKVVGTSRAFLSAAMLPKAILSQFSDLVPRSLVAAGNGVPVMRQVGEFFSEMAANRSPEFLADVRRLGVDADIALKRLEDEGATGVVRAVQGVNDAVLRYTGFRRWNDVGARVSQMGILRRLADVKGLAFDAADEAMNGRLSRYGYDAATWDALRSLPTERIDGIDYMSVGAVMDSALPDAQKLALSQRLIHHVGTDGAIAMTQPGHKVRAALAFGGQRGTALGELARSGTQFKGFSTQYVLNQVGEMLRVSGGDRVKYASALLFGTTALGMISLQSKRLAKGQGLADMNDPSTWLAAMMQGGGIGILGDFVSAGLGGSSRFGKDFLMTMAGPSASFVDDAVKLVGGNIREAATGERANFGSELAKFAGNYTPGLNAPFLGIAAQRLMVDQARLWADPTGTRRSFMTMETKQRNEFGARYWWRPGQTRPEFLR